MRGTWHDTSVEDLLLEWYFDEEYFNASSIHPTHYENIQHWCSENDGHGTYPPEDLDNIDTWSTVLNTTQTSNNYHIVEEASTTEYTYLRISEGCSADAGIPEYVRITH